MGTGQSISEFFNPTPVDFNNIGPVRVPHPAIHCGFSLQQNFSEAVENSTFRD
jgi:hypothetical protein